MQLTGVHGRPRPVPEALHDSKVYVEKALLASELNTLVSQLSKVAASGRHSRDFTLNDLRRVLVEVVACFRVYRTYIRPGEPVSDRDREYIEQAVARARRRLPTVDRSVHDFVQDVLLLNAPADLSLADRALWERFVIRFQQTTGPVQAKGLEDHDLLPADAAPLAQRGRRRPVALGHVTVRLPRLEPAPARFLARRLLDDSHSRHQAG